MLALFSIPGKRGRSGSRAPVELAPPSAAKHGPVGKCQRGSPELRFCLWSDGETPLSQLKDSPSQAGFGVPHPPLCGYLLVSPLSSLPVCVGMVEGAVLALPPLFQDFQAHELPFFLEMAQPGWRKFRSCVTWGPLDACTQRKLYYELGVQKLIQ